MVREYKWEEGKVFFRKETERAILEIVPTKEFGDAIFLDNALQLAEKDEYIYHEMLVHPCLASAKSLYDVLVMGGGDGCAAREILKWKDVRKIDILDWDKDLTDFFSEKYSSLNKGSLKDPKVTIENKDICEYNDDDQRRYDCIVIDLLDPIFTGDTISFWEQVLSLAKRWVDPYGCIVINAGGIYPWDTQDLNILTDIVESYFDWNLHLYKVFVPSFGREWCFLLLNHQETLKSRPLPHDLRYCSPKTWKYAYSYGWTPEYFHHLHLNITHQIEEDE